MRRIGMRSVLRAVVRLDSVGAVFVALGAAGGLWCAWVVVDRQLGHELDSAAGRSDLVLDLTPMFILASVIGSLGVALRVTSAIRSASTIRLVGRPVGTMLLVAAGVLTALLGGIAVTRDERDETTTPAFDMNAFAEDPRLDRLEPEP